MFEYFHGEVAERGDGSAVLDVNGVAYRLACSASTLRRLPPRGPARLFAHLVVREDRQELYGFFDRAERHLFRQLLQVSGVGPAVGLALCSSYEPEALAAHIAAGDLACLVRVKGVGKRTAERILVELRDRVAKEGGKASPTAPTGGARADAVLALCSLGLPRSEAERRVAAVKGDDLEVEDVVRQALG